MLNLAPSVQQKILNKTIDSILTVCILTYMKRITEKQRIVNDRHRGIVGLYKSGRYTTEKIALVYNVSVRQVQRVAKDAGIIRTQAEANKLMAPFKNYHTTPVELRVKRKQLTLKTRYSIIKAHPYCTNCGRRPDEGIRLEVDHIDENAENNAPENLQVLCSQCNTGKSHKARFANATS